MADLQNWWHHSLLDLHPLFQSLSPVMLYLALLIAIVALLSILHFFFFVFDSSKKDSDADNITFQKEATKTSEEKTAFSLIAEAVIFQNSCLFQKANISSSCLSCSCC